MIDPDAIRRVGMLTPSSNTVLEPYTAAMFAPFGEAASVHFSRFRVVDISLSGASRRQFETGPMLEAAERLAEARVHRIAWSGTSASWLGLETDRALCDAIEARTGVSATSTMLAFAEALGTLGARRLALVTPYIGEIQRRIVENFRSGGYDIVADERLDDRGKFSFAGYGTDEVATLARRAARSDPDAILIVCTNFRGAPVAAALEAENGIPVIDSVAVTAWWTMHAVGLDPSRVRGWGRVFALPDRAR